MNNSKEFRIVVGKWHSQVEYFVSIKCPYCGYFITEDDLMNNYSSISEGKKINRQIKCMSCSKKFKLMVSGAE